MKVDFKKNRKEQYLTVGHKIINLETEDQFLTDDEIKAKKSQEIVYEVIDIIEKKYNLKTNYLDINDKLLFLSAGIKEKEEYDCSEVSIAYLITSNVVFNKRFKLSSQHLQENNIKEIDVFNNLNTITEDKEINELLKGISSIMQIKE